MVHFNDIVSPDALATEVTVNGKKMLFQKIAALAAQSYGVDAEAAADALLERERLGSTGFGGGVAIPHAKLPGTIYSAAEAVKAAGDESVGDHMTACDERQQ